MPQDKLSAWSLSEQSGISIEHFFAYTVRVALLTQQSTIPNKQSTLPTEQNFGGSSIC